MKVLVCGGRNYGTNLEEYREIVIALEKELCSIPDENDMETWLPPKDLHIIAGGAKGVDTCAIDWAIVNWVQFTEVKADWDKYGKAAGTIRNAEMLKLEPDLVIAFRGGKGTANMIKQAKDKGVPVKEIT